MSGAGRRRACSCFAACGTAGTTWSITCTSSSGIPSTAHSTCGGPGAHARKKSWVLWPSQYPWTTKSRSVSTSGASSYRGPGSGKSAVLLEVAVRAARGGIRVLIVCPIGQLVHSFKSQVPELDGVEHIQIDTIHGVLRYKRPGANCYEYV